MKKIFFITCLSIFSFITSTLNAKTMSISNNIDEKFIAENISIFDARIRSLDTKTYVKELLLVNFSETSWNTVGIGFSGVLFKDDGKDNDLKANDGIFTSVLNFRYNNEIMYDSRYPIKYVMDQIIISSQFKHLDKLDKYTENYNYSTYGKGKIKPGGYVKCDFKVVSSGCLADDLWCGFGCVELSNCSFKIEW